MVTIAPQLTDAGKNLLIRAISGEQIIFTRFKIGNGELTSGTSQDKLTDLVNPLVSFLITSITPSTGYNEITGSFSSTDIKSDFRWRELGLFCKGKDNIEVLYAYSNDGDGAGLLKSNATDVVAEQKVTLIVATGDAANVTAIISESVLYATKKELVKHSDDKNNPHDVTARQLNLEKVQNVDTNNQTPTYTPASNLSELISGEKLSLAFGKIAKAISDFMSHTKSESNPHKITPKGIKAADKEHVHATSDINSGTLDVARGGTGKSAWTKSGILFATAPGAMSQISVPPTASVLAQNGADPYWLSVSALPKKTATIVVGTSLSGRTLNECDYICDGVDDQAEINAALMAIPTGGGKVLILDGEYKISSNINVSKIGTQLMGVGGASLTFAAITTADGIATSACIRITASKCSISGLCLIGQETDTRPNYARALYALACDRMLISNLRVKNAAILLENCTNSIVQSNFVGEGNGYKYGICLSGGNGNVVSANNLSDAYYGICAQTETNISIIGNSTAVTNDYGIYCSGCKFITVTGNSVNSKVGGYVNGYLFESCEMLSFCNNSASLADVARGEAATLRNCAKITVMGNVLKTLTAQSALALLSCIDGVVCGNILASTNGAAALSIESCTNVTSINNLAFTMTS